MTNRADAISVWSGTAVNVVMSKPSDYHETDLFVRIEKIKDLVIRLCDVSMSHVTLPCTALWIYGFPFSTAHYQ